MIFTYYKSAVTTTSKSDKKRPSLITPTKESTAATTTKTTLDDLNKELDDIYTTLSAQKTGVEEPFEETKIDLLNDRVDSILEEVRRTQKTLYADEDDPSTDEITDSGRSILAKFILTLTPASVLLESRRQPSLHHPISFSDSFRVPWTVLTSG